MDRVLNPKDDKQAIYEIYRACRLCGAGAGYKMPIIQNVIDLQGDGMELRQKIKECVQIEVNHTDRMPPLICELCVDKVNDFHEFLDLCRKTNKRTRLSLGLPLQAGARGEDSVNCVRGARERDTASSDGEPPAKTRSKKTRISKETVDVKIKVEGGRPPPRAPASSPAPSPAPAFKRITRLHADTLLYSPQPKELPKTVPSPKSVKPVLRKTEEPTPPVEKSKLKRAREKYIKTETPPPAKKVKLAPEPARPSQPGPKSSKNTQIEPKDPASPKTPAPKTPASKTPASKTPASRTPASKTPASKTPASKTPSSKTPASKTPASKTPSSESPSSKAPVSKVVSLEAPKSFFCRICEVHVKNSQGFSKHNLTKHQPTFTSPKLACNACEAWFPAAEQALAHHRAHRDSSLPYKCTRCYGYFKLQEEYEDHFAENMCLSVYEVPDVKCWECWRTFPTNKLLEEHRCLGEDGRPGGKCSKCERSYSLLKNLVKHESGCTYQKKVEMSEVQASLLPMQVRIARCDPLLRRGGHVDVARLSHNYGLDSKRRYPYLPVRPALLPSEPPPTDTSRVLSNHDPVKGESITDSFAHWDTDHSDHSDSETKIDSLSAMSLDTINSKESVGPRKRRKVKSDGFDADLDVSKRIDSILVNLAMEDRRTSCSCDSDSILDRSTAVQASEEAKPSVNEDNHTNNDSQISNDLESVLNDNGDKVDGKVEDKEIKNDASSEKVDAVCDMLGESSDKLDVCQLDVISDKLVLTSDMSEIAKNTTSIGSENEAKRFIGNESDEIMKERDDETKSVAENDKASHDDLEERIHVGTSNSDSDEGTEQNKIEISNDTDKNQEFSIDLRETKNDSLTNENLRKNDNVDSNNQSVQDSLTEGTLASGVNEQKEDKLRNSNLVSDNIVTNECVKINEENNHEDDEVSKNEENKHLNVTHLEKFNDNFSKIDEITKKILKENETSQEYSRNDSDDKHTDDVNDESHERSDPCSDAISLNSGKSFNANGFDIRDKFNIDDLNDDDKKLMADIDAQIGEDDQGTAENDQRIYGNDQKNGENLDIAGTDQRFKENHTMFGENDESFSRNDHKLGENDQNVKENHSFTFDTHKHSIDGILKKQNDQKSLELDAISDDEFNFDA